MHFEIPIKVEIDARASSQFTREMVVEQLDKLQLVRDSQAWLSKNPDYSKIDSEILFLESVLQRKFPDEHAA